MLTFTMSTLIGAAFFALCMGPFEVQLLPIEKPSNFDNDSVIANMIRDLTLPHADCMFPPRDVLLNLELNEFKFLEKCYVKLEVDSNSVPEINSLLCMSLFDIGLRLCQLDPPEAFTSAIKRIPHDAIQFRNLLKELPSKRDNESELCTDLNSVLPKVAAQPLTVPVWNLKRALELEYSCHDICFEYYHMENMFCKLILWVSNLLHNSKFKTAAPSDIFNESKANPKIEDSPQLSQTDSLSINLAVSQTGYDPSAVKPSEALVSSTLLKQHKQSEAPLNEISKVSKGIPMEKLPHQNIQHNEKSMAHPKDGGDTDSNYHSSEPQLPSQAELPEDDDNYQRESQDPSQAETHDDDKNVNSELQVPSQTNKNQDNEYSKSQDLIQAINHSDKSTSGSQPFSSPIGKQIPDFDQNSKSIPQIHAAPLTDPPGTIVQETSVDQSILVGDNKEDNPGDDSEIPNQEDIDENINIVGDDDQTVQGETPIRPDVNEDDMQSTNPINSYMPEEGFEGSEDSHFFVYFMSMILFCIFGYLIFHNKQKIMALALEGRSRRTGSRRRPNSANYHKLDCNLEEAVSSPCSTSNTHVIY